VSPECYGGIQVYDIARFGNGRTIRAGMQLDF
jgi:hypothetical protein